MKILLFILLSIQMLSALEIKELKKGDIIEDSVEKLEKKYYKVGIQNLHDIRLTLTNLSNDVDLYLRTDNFFDKWDKEPIMENLVPTLRRNDCYSSNSNRQNEECYYQVIGPAPGSYDANVYILVYGFKAGSYRLEVKEEEREKIHKISKNPIKGKVKKGESTQYKIYGKAGETIAATIFNLTDDADLRLKIGRKAGLHVFDCKSTNGKNKKDECSVTLTKNATVYIQVYGYKSANYSITASHIENNVDNILIKKATDFCLNNQGRTINDSDAEIICAEMHGQQDGAYVLDKKNYRILYVKNAQIVQQKSVKRGNQPTRIIDNKDNESYTIAYYNGVTYNFYAFLGNEIKEVLKYNIPNQSEVTKVYIAQKNSDIWQIYLEYTNKESGQSYRDVYDSNHFSNIYSFQSHTEI